MIGELLVDGRDIAGAAGLPWIVPSDHAAMMLALFLGVALPRIIDPEGPAVPGAKDLSLELWPDGCRPVAVIGSAGKVQVGDATGGPVDVRIAGDPAAVLLTTFDRMSPARGLVRGRLRVRGRRPWRLARLRAMFSMP